MTFFGIIIPFRPKVSSANWETESQLLRQTLFSVLNQSYKNFKIFVIYTDLPIDPVQDSRISYSYLEGGYQSYEQIGHREKLLQHFQSEKLVVSRWDKGKKIVFGCQLAKEAGCEYIMPLDSDDLISSRLFAYCAAEAEKKSAMGWYAEKGFLYQQGSRHLIRVPKNMRLVNGSTHILKAQLIQIPHKDSTDWLDFNFFTDHGWIKDRVQESNGAILEPIPFPAVVYVVHKSNISKVHQEYST